MLVSVRLQHSLLLCLECEPHSGPGLGVRSAEADPEKGRGDQGG